MESNVFKSVMFGGFDRQDVINYIEKTSQESAAAMQALQQETESLKAERAAAQSELESLRREVEELRQQSTQLQSALTEKIQEADAMQQELNTLRPAHQALLSQVQEWKPQAEAYQKVKEHIGNIECEARKRADELEDATNARLSRTLLQCGQQYQALRATFETASTHVTEEMRKIEVSISQLPVAFDKLGSDLKELESLLKP